MPRFYLHVRNGDDVALDEEGEELTDLEGAREEAVESARELWSELLLQRRDPTRYSVEIADETGETVLVVPFTAPVERTQCAGPSFGGLDANGQIDARTPGARPARARGHHGTDVP